MDRVVVRLGVHRDRLVHLDNRHELQVDDLLGHRDDFYQRGSTHCCTLIVVSPVNRTHILVIFGKISVSNNETLKDN